MSSHAATTDMLLVQADQRRNYARDLYDRRTGPNATVVYEAWMAAVDFIDAYLYEYNWGLPTTPELRSKLVGRVRDLQAIATGYWQLENDAGIIYHVRGSMDDAAAYSALMNLDAILEHITLRM
jgi:hypothetical protein